MSAEGQEILVVDADPRVQRGIDQMLRSAGLTPTVMGDVERALDLSSTKHFAVALVDLDTPHEGEGIRVLSALRERSPRTALVALAPRRTFDAAAVAFRSGVDDVVVKAPDQVGYLRDRVVTLAAGREREDTAEDLARQAAALHDDFFKVLLDTHKRMVELEQTASPLPAGDTLSLLVVDDAGWLGGHLRSLLDADGHHVLAEVATGGEALDIAGRERFQIALVKEELIDLPGSMVARTIKTQSPDTIVLTYSPPEGPRPGAVQVIDAQRTISFIPAFVAVQQLAARLGELSEAYHATTRERRYLASFRQQHFDLLRRYQEMKQKLQKTR
jgi:DNA-binding NtrC family response regulator